MKTFYTIHLILSMATGMQAAAAGTNTMADLATRVGAVSQSAALMYQWSGTTEERLAVPPAPAPADLAAVLESACQALAQQRAEVERLQRELEELRVVRTTTQEAETDLEIKIQEWQARVARAQEELQRLMVREAELRRQLTELSNSGQGFSPGSGSGDLKQLDVIVIKGNLVAPTDPPYFTLTRIRYTQSGDTGLKMEQIQDGVPLARALESRGWLDEMLAKADPKKQFLTVFVTADSIPTYYALRAELRKRNIRHMWVAWDAEPILTRSGPPRSGGGITIGY